MCIFNLAKKSHMKTRIQQCIIICLFCLNASSQNNSRKPILDPANKEGSAIKSAEFTLKCAGEITTPSADLKWRPGLITKCIGKEHSFPEEELIKKMKAEKTALKLASSQNKYSAIEKAAGNITPIVGTNFLGNTNNGGSPMDNSIAISDGGWIVSVANTTIEYDDENGTNAYFNTITSFFNDNSISSVCDPVVIYDSGADRFIFFAQECSGASGNSFLLICFSKSNNPNDGWWKYKLTGNPLNNSKWFDYPKLAVSTNELYISGNLFSNSPGSVFSTAVLYQIQKTNGFTGGTFNYQYWTGMTGSPFTVLPLSNGQQGNYGPGCYLVSTIPGGGNTVKLYDLTDDMSAANEQLNYYSVPTTSYAPAGDASQLGTTCLLDNGDCRTLSGFYLNGTIHFVFHSDIGGGWNGINYNRLNVNTKTNQSTKFGFAGDSDYSYPSVCSYATSAMDAAVMIGFGRCGANMYPEVRVAHCDNNLNWSSSVLIKSSASYVTYTSTSKERWGDYTGITRRHNSTRPSVWASGMYGTSNKLWNTWVAEVHDNDIYAELNENSFNRTEMKLYPNPVIDNFTLEFNLDQKTDLQIDIKDMNGKLIKQLYKGFGNVGGNVFSFNKANLSEGIYFLVISNQNNIIKNEKISIHN